MSDPATLVETPADPSAASLAAQKEASLKAEREARALEVAALGRDARLLSLAGVELGQKTLSALFEPIAARSTTDTFVVPDDEAEEKIAEIIQRVTDAGHAILRQRSRRDIRVGVETKQGMKSITGADLIRVVLGQDAVLAKALFGAVRPKK